MKVKDILNQLNNLDNEDEVCAMLFTKQMFESHEYKITKSEWKKLCKAFDSSPMTSNIFEELTYSIDYEHEEEELS